MKYICLAYEEESKLNSLTRSEWDLLRNETLAYVEALRHRGTLISTEPLQSVHNATIHKRTMKMSSMQKLTTFLWFDKEAGEAAKFYASVFKGAKIKDTTTLQNTPSGTVEIVTMEIFGQDFRLMSAGPFVKFNESISFVVPCETQDEIDYYWEKLSADPKAEQCGWLKDKYGLSWQIVPTVLLEMQTDKDAKKVSQVPQAFLKMKKFDIEKLKQAYEEENSKS